MIVLKKLSAVLVVITIAGFLFGCDSNKKPYEEAEALLNDKKYEEAIAAFEALGNYKDASERAEEALEEAKNDRLSSLWSWGGLIPLDLRVFPYSDGIFKPDGVSVPKDLSRDELDNALANVFPGLRFSSSITGRSDGQERYVFSESPQAVQLDLKDGFITYATVVEYDGTCTMHAIRCGMSLDDCLDRLNLPPVSVGGDAYELLFPTPGGGANSHDEENVKPPCVYVRRDAENGELMLVLASPSESADGMINELDFFFDSDGLLVQWSMFAFD